MGNLTDLEHDLLDVLSDGKERNSIEVFFAHRARGETYAYFPHDIQTALSDLVDLGLVLAFSNGNETAYQITAEGCLIETPCIYAPNVDKTREV